MKLLKDINLIVEKDDKFIEFAWQEYDEEEEEYGTVKYGSIDIDKTFDIDADVIMRGLGEDDIYVVKHFLGKGLVYLLTNI